MTRIARTLLRRPAITLALVLLLVDSAPRAEGRAPRASETVATRASDPLLVRKLEAEIEKLESEVANLRAVDARTRWWTTVLTAVGSIVGALVGGAFTLVVTRMGFRFNRLQREIERDRATREEVRREQEDLLSRLKLRQEREHARELHDLRLFQDLGHESHRARLAAAAVLLDRLQRLRDPANAEELTPLEATEGRLITKVLVAVLKRSGVVGESYAGNERPSADSDDGVEVLRGESEAALRKYIADELVETLGARFSRDSRPANFGQSPLGDGREFQDCDLTDVYWAFVDARRLDFFGSDLTKASLRGAALQEAVFYEATLSEAVLRDADLRRANLMGADLRRADLRDADLRGANLQAADLGGADLRGALLEGAVINVAAIQRFQATRWPDGFLDATEAGARVMDDTYRPAS